MDDDISNLPENNDEWRRQKNKENAIKARVALKVKLEREKQKLLEQAAKEPEEEPQPEAEPEPHYIETNKEPEPKRFFWDDPKFRAARKRFREEMETNLEPESKKPKTEEPEVSYWSQTKEWAGTHITGIGKVFVTSLFVLCAQSLARRMHSEMEGQLIQQPPFSNRSNSRFLNPE
jgi:hypothetical protein